MSIRLSKVICRFLRSSYTSRCLEYNRHCSNLPSKGGLFGLGTVRSPTDFRSLTDHVYERGRTLLTEALNGGRRKRKLVENLDELSDTICQAADMAECVRMIHPNPTYANEAEECVSQLGQFVESLNSNRELYLALRDSYETGESKSSCDEFLDEIDRRVMELLIDDMETSGVHLPDTRRCQFIDYNSGIFTIGSEFVRAAHEFKTMRNTRTMSKGEFHQRQKDRLKTLLTLRHELAQLVGYDSYADRTLKSTFLESPTRVNEFLTTLVGELKSRTTSRSNTREINPVEDENGVAHLTLRQLINEKINPVAERLVGLHFERWEPKGDEIWHPSVTKLIAFDASQKPLGTVYCDWYDRERKCGDAHFTVRCGRQIRSRFGQGSVVNDYQSPIVVLSFRLGTFGNENKDDLWATPFALAGNNAETIFHEFGHALHTLVGRTRYQHVSGTRCSTDLAEIPSTFLEHFVLDEKASLTLWGSTFDGHRSRTHRNGIVEMLDQSVLALTDLQLHMVRPTSSFMEDVTGSISDQLGLPLVSEDRFLIFEHLVPYGAKYHSYIVARALAALLWRRNETSTKLDDNKHSATTYHRFLSYGGEKYPDELIKLTLDHVPSAQALAKSLAADIAGNIEPIASAREKQSRL